MRLYELGVVLDPTLSEEEIASVTERLKKAISAQDGSVGKVDFWGKRKLAYPIDKKTEGFYSFLEFNLAPERIEEVRRAIKFMEGILRFVIVRKPEEAAKETKVEEEPTPPVVASEEEKEENSTSAQA